jgi:hypothetical protein
MKVNEFGFTPEPIIFINSQARSAPLARPNLVLMFTRWATLLPHSSDWTYGEIERTVEILMDFGFGRCDCKCAMCSVFCNVDRIVENPLFGVISSQQSPELDRFSD